MNRLLSKSLVLAAILGSVVGCGGAGTAGLANTSQFAGTYSAAYTRSTGSMIIAVDSSNQVTITIADGAAGNFVGTGSVNHVGGFFVTCTGANNQTVSVAGTLRGSGLGRTAAGTVSGTISVAYSANLLSSPDASLYANHYNGFYEQGAASGDWFGDVDSHGNFSGQLIVGQNSTLVPITGNVYSNGSFNITGTAGSTRYAAQGNFHLSTAPQGVFCDGILKGTAGGEVTTGNFSGHIAEEG